MALIIFIVAVCLAAAASWFLDVETKGRALQEELTKGRALQEELSQLDEADSEEKDFAVLD
jgi:hypothetical protein